MNLRMQWAEWLNGLIAGLVTALGSSVTTYAGQYVFGGHVDLKPLLGGCAVTTIFTAGAWMAMHKIPPVFETETTTVTKVEDKLAGVTTTTTETKSSAVQGSVVPSPVVPAAGAKEE